MSEKGPNKDLIDQADQTLSSSEQWVEKNFKVISIAAAAVILCVAGYFAYSHYILAPKAIKAQTELFRGEFYMQADSFRVALEGNGGDYKGLLAIIDEAGSTDAGNLAKAYAGIAYKNLGEYETAISYLKDFSADDILAAPAMVGAIGDCYVEMQKVAEGISYFEKAAKLGNNDMISPIYLKKAGIAYESLGQYDNAIKAYTEIKENYASSIEGRDIEKYIERAKLKK